MLFVQSDLLLEYNAIEKNITSTFFCQQVIGKSIGTVPMHFFGCNILFPIIIKFVQTCLYFNILDANSTIYKQDTESK